MMENQNNFGNVPPVNPESNYTPYGNSDPASQGGINLSKDNSTQTGFDAGNAYNPQDVYNQQPQFNNPMGGFNDDFELNKRANNVKTLGIVAIIVSVVVGFCCCIIPGPVVGIVGLVKANGLGPMLPNMSEEAQNNVKVGKICCIIAIALGVAGLIFNIISNFIMGGTNVMSEILNEAMNEMY